jgi:hypothetical protein
MLAVRITQVAHTWAEVARGYSGETTVDYASWALAERWREDARAGHA